TTTQQRPLTGWDKPELDLTNAQWQSSSRGRGVSAAQCFTAAFVPQGPPVVQGTQRKVTVR
ncbi:hypothetical protein ACWDZW_33445, partial [Streptomyces coeruleorubidus]